jgi:hypothetical protein
LSGVRKNRSHSWEKTEPPGLRTPTTGTSLLVKHVDILKTSWESSIGKLFLHWWPEPLLCRPLYDPLPPAWTLSLQRLSGVKKNIKKYTDQSQTVTPRRLHLGEQEVEPAHRITSPLSSREATPSLFSHLQIWPKLWCPGTETRVLKRHEVQGARVAELRAVNKTPVSLFPVIIRTTGEASSWTQLLQLSHLLE